LLPLTPRPPSPTLFAYTTLFRSAGHHHAVGPGIGSAHRGDAEGVAGRSRYRRPVLGPLITERSRAAGGDAEGGALAGTAGQTAWPAGGSERVHCQSRRIGSGRSTRVVHGECVRANVCTRHGNDRKTAIRSAGNVAAVQEPLIGQGRDTGGGDREGDGLAFTPGGSGRLLGDGRSDAIIIEDRDGPLIEVTEQFDVVDSQGAIGVRGVLGVNPEFNRVRQV